MNWIKPYDEFLVTKKNVIDNDLQEIDSLIEAFRSSLFIKAKEELNVHEGRSDRFHDYRHIYIFSPFRFVLYHVAKELAIDNGFNRYVLYYVQRNPRSDSLHDFTLEIAQSIKKKLLVDYILFGKEALGYFRESLTLDVATEARCLKQTTFISGDLNALIQKCNEDKGSYEQYNFEGHKANELTEQNLAGKSLHDTIITINSYIRSLL